MGVWVNGNFYRPKAGTVLKVAFDYVIRQRLGEFADPAWDIISKFDGHDIGFDAVMILEQAVRKENPALGIELLKKVWSDIIEKGNIPPFSDMTDLQKATLTNTFLITDLQIIQRAKV